MTGFEVGDFVYASFFPRRPGKVLEVRGDAWASELIVRWVDGKTSRESALGIRDFNKLITDHEKKLATHRSNLERLAKL